MRITFNPSVLNTAPVRAIRPVRSVEARPAAREEERAEPDPVEPVTVGLSSRGLAPKADQEPPPRDDRRRKPLWTMMVNLSRLEPSKTGD